MYWRRGRTGLAEYCGSVGDNGFLSGQLTLGPTELVSTGLWKGWEEPEGGPDPVKESSPENPPPILSPGRQGLSSQHSDLGAFVSSSAFHESFHSPCQIRRQGGCAAPLAPRARGTGWARRKAPIG